MPESLISIAEAKTGRPVRALDDARIGVTSEGLGWTGLGVEVGENDDWDVTALTTAEHYVAVHLGGDPARVEFGAGASPRPVVLQPGQVWVSGAGTPFSWRVEGTVRYAGLTLDPALVERLTGLDDLPVSLHDDDAALAHLVRALAAEAEAGGPNGPAFAQTLALAASQHLARRYGHAAVGPDTPGALDRTRLQRVLDYVEAHVASAISLDDLAAQAMLSVSHFTASFKAAVGVTPYRYVARRRAERARELLASGRYRAGEAARALGYADPSHLTRAFKQHFGTTPSRFLREAAR
ncbi:MAG: AraC family transcriptional regulator [Bacteroidota bacterium]